MKAYKAFRKGLKSICGNYTYGNGKTHSQDRSLFFAAEDPYFCLRFGKPEDSEYHEVELSGITTTSGVQDNRSWDYTEATGQSITIGREVSVAEMLWLSYLYRLSWTREEQDGDTDVERGCSVTSREAKVVTAYGDKSVAVARTAGSCARCQGNRSAACAEGRRSRAYAGGTDSLAIALGPDSCAAGERNNWLLLTDRGQHPEGTAWPKTVAVLVDGEQFREKTYYQLKNGQIVPVKRQ